MRGTVKAHSDIQLEEHLDECFLRLVGLSLGSLAGLALGVTHALKQAFAWSEGTVYSAVVSRAGLDPRSQISCLGACAAASRWRGTVQTQIGDDTVRGASVEAC